MTRVNASSELVASVACHIFHIMICIAVAILNCCHGDFASQNCPPARVFQGWSNKRRRLQTITCFVNFDYTESCILRSHTCKPGNLGMTMFMMHPIAAAHEHIVSTSAG